MLELSQTVTKNYSKSQAELNLPTLKWEVINKC